MTTAIVNHLWQSTVIVIAAALVAFALRRNQARTRHAVWLAASLKFLLPFSLLISLGGALTWRTAEAPVTIAPTLVETVQTMTEPFAESTVGSAPTNVTQTPTAIPWFAMLGSAWIVGTFVVLAIRLRGWLSVRALLRASAPATLGDVEVGLNMRAASGLLEPGIVGILRPVLLVPVGLDSTLSPEQLRAVVSHELHHVRRRDNLTSTLHMIVEALFWFHPLVWWVGARLIDERERACDEYVLASGAAADAYAEGILNVCKRYVESPVACVSGVTGSDLKKRIGAILAGRVGVRLTIARRVLLVASVLVVMGIPIAAGAIGSSTGIVPPEGARDAMRPTSLSAPPAGQRFDVASVRPCDPSTIPTGRAGGRGAGAGSPTTNSDDKGTASSGRLYLHCETLWRLVQQAYLGRESLHAPIAGGPSWVGTDPFDIEAAVSSDTPEAALRGPLLQRLLEERFHLQIHREARSRPVYALRPAKGGFKLTALSDGMCLPIAGVPSGRARCGTLSVRYGADERLIDVSGQTISGLAEVLENYVPLDRPVIDMTSISGVFDFHLRFGTAGPPDQMLAAAIQPQIGLALDATTGPAEFLVIDHVERPDFADAGGSLGQAPAAGRPASPPKAPDAIPKFDVVSVRPCASGAQAPSRSDAGRSPVTSPGRLYLQCYSLSGMFQEAYVFFAGGRAHGLGGFTGVDVEGGPDWKDSDRFLIEAKTNQNPSPAVMRGPMLQAVLEERFKLKMHRETRQMPIYELAAAKSGAKISPYTDHDCVIKDDAAWPVPELPVGQRYCGDHIAMDGDQIVRTGVMSLDQLFSLILFDRPVVNKTGITAPVSYRFEYARADARMGEPPGASIVKALRDQLGLDLRASKGPRLFLVIDHAERPTGEGMGAK